MAGWGPLDDRTDARARRAQRPERAERRRREPEPPRRVRAGTSPGGRSRERGQITFDFAVGVSVFLLTVALAFALVPNVLGSGGERGAADAAAADRFAAWVAEDALVPDGEADARVDCAAELLTGAGARAPACGFDAASFADALPADAGPVNVTLLRDGTIQCPDGAGGLVDRSGSCDLLAAGPDLSDADGVGVARRAVQIGEVSVTVEVRVA